MRIKTKRQLQAFWRNNIRFPLMMIVVAYLLFFVMGNITFSIHPENCYLPANRHYVYPFLYGRCIYKFQTFNPEWEVCEIYQGQTNDASLIDVFPEECDEFYPNGKCIINAVTTNEGQRILPCKDWRPKNECELDPKIEGCICDEWENPTMEGYNDCSFFKESILNVLYNDSYRCIDGKLVYCIKAHEIVK